MLTIRTDEEGRMYQFAENEYTEYVLTEAYFVVKKDKQWVGIFDRGHLISVIYDSTNN